MRIALPIRFRSALDDLPGDVDVSWYRVPPSSAATDAAAPRDDIAAYVEAVKGADIWWLAVWNAGEVDAVLRSAPGLRWVHTHVAGVDGLPVGTFAELGLLFTNGSGAHAVPIAEYVLAALLAASKNLPQLLAAQAAGLWQAAPPIARELADSRALIIGLGGIGTAIAQRLRGLGVRVTGVRRHIGDEEDVIGSSEWRSRLPEFDWIILTCPLTNETFHMLGRAEVASCKPSAWIFNVSRGPLIDTDALIWALKSRAVSGAYLDVTDPEPLPKESELWRMPNVIITPHIAAYSEHFERRSAELFLDNLARWRSGRELRNVVDLRLGY